MKKLFLLATLFCYTVVSALAQHDHSGGQKQTSTPDSDTLSNTSEVNGQTAQQFSRLFASYINLKNALVAGDANSAASNADEFLWTVNTIDFKVISEANLHILSNQAGKISSTSDLKKQRAYFIGLSSNLVTIAKAFKLSDKPVFVLYCPMQKASWLSAEKQIRNPYYGSSMLTCGELTDTL